MIKWAVVELPIFWDGLEDLCREVPEDWLASARKYRRDTDRGASLLGRVLLAAMLRSDGRNPGDHRWHGTAFKKPYLLGRGGLVHFSISHCENMVACAYSPDMPVGLDLERCKPRSLPSFEKILTIDEMNFLRNAEGPERAMCEIWTRKEAVAKASGKGMYLPFGSFSTLGDCVVVEGDTYQINALDAPSGYMLCAAVKSIGPISMRHLEGACRGMSVHRAL